MKTKTFLLVLAAISFGLQSPTAFAQGFNSGSDGSMGALNVTVNTNLTMPPDGIFKFTTIAVDFDRTVTFTRNALNTPVYLLATGDVVINGTLNVSGANGGSFILLNGGAGGPGGFDGGRAGGDGHGPGAGRMGTDGSGPDSAGSGSYGTRNPNGGTNNHGRTYGSPLLVPLVGGSGGGGSPTTGGGGGGGAILVASNTRIQIIGRVEAQGGNRGSSGAIRLVAPAVQGNGNMVACCEGGAGRVRVDMIDRTGFALTSNPQDPISIGSFMMVFPPNLPRLDIIAAADTTIPEGTSSPVVINLPFGSDTNRTVTVQARSFNAIVPIEVVLTPDLGPSLIVQTQINNTLANPATVTVPFAFPVNTPVAVNAWRR